MLDYLSRRTSWFGMQETLLQEKGDTGMRKMLVNMLLLGGLVLFIGTSTHAQTKSPITEEDLGSFIQNLPLVFRGIVTAVEVKPVDASVLLGPGKGGQRIATEVTIRIEKVLAGEYGSKEIQILLQEGKLGNLSYQSADFAPMKVSVGDPILAGIVPNTMGSGYNVVTNRRTLFKIVGQDLVPYQQEYYLAADKPFEIIAKKAKERETAELYKAADLVCIGIVAKLIDPTKPSRRMVVSIGEFLKGTAEGRKITVDVSDVYQPFMSQKPGYSVLLFLRKNGAEYRPVAGVNGYYVIHGDSLSRGHNTPMRTGVSELKVRIKSLEEVEK